MRSIRAQGAFEYILLLAGILLIVVVVITVLRVSVIPAANQTLQGGLQQWQAMVNFCQDESTATLGIDGATATIALCQAADPEQTQITISSTPITFNGSNATDRAYMNWSQDNKTIVLNITGKAGSPLNVSEPHGITVVVAGTTLVSSKTAQQGCTPSEFTPDANTVGLWHFDDGGPNPLTADSSTLGLWHFNESSGSTAYDGSPYGNNGTIVNAVYTPNGRFGGAYSFDGNNDYVEVADNDKMFNNISGTIELWFKLPAGFNLSAISTTRMHLLNKDATGTQNDLVMFIAKTTGALYLNIQGPTDVMLLSDSASWNNEQWYHAAATYGPTGIYLYINGVRQGTFSSNPYGVRGGTDPLRIGKASGGYADFNGTIDEVAVYNRSLTATEIAQHAGAFARDSSQYANNGTLYNAANASWADGKYGNAIRFYGLNGRIRANTPNLSSGDFTLESWIKTRETGRALRILQLASSNILLLVNSSGKLVGRIYNPTDGNFDTVSTGTVPTNAWTHVAMSVYNNQTQHRTVLYINGVQDGSRTFTAFPNSVDFIDVAGTYGSEFFNGTIDEVRILNRALNASEVYYDRWCH
jgi:hypothetical protein